MRDVASSPPLRVLVVDDCPDMTASMGILLRSWGHEPREAHAGAEALDVAAAFRPDVILLDLRLPDMDGCRVARRLREEMDLRNTVLAILTGCTDPEDCRRSLEAGCDRHLIKPLDSSVLAGLLASWKKDRDELLAVERAEIRLRGNSYLALKNVSCECLDGVLTLRGCLPSYYLKQVAQASVADVEGVLRIDNRIEVISGPRGKQPFLPLNPALPTPCVETKSTKSKNGNY